MAVEVSIEIVGADLLSNMKDPAIWERMQMEMLKTIGMKSVTSIQNEIRNRKWKSGTPASLINSTKFVVGKNTVEVRVDKSFAIYQERGVRRHEMRYLLNAKGPIPLMIKGGNVGRGHGALIFRRATEKWMGVEHVVNGPTPALVGKLKAGRITKPKKELVNHAPYLATGWVNPGYPGKFFFRDGIKNAAYDITREIKGITLRVAYNDLNIDLSGVSVERPVDLEE